jgi:DNA ligase-1
MPDLKDGESHEMQGSGSRPYVLKNTGGLYSCSCPAWRNQSIGIERRTCKHLRKLRGDAAEEARIGSALPAKPVAKEGEVQSPELLLAESWDLAADPTGWWLSEKLDGVRAYWDGTQFLSRQGNLFHAPDWFIAGLPGEPLDGELWLGRKKFQRTVSIVRRQDKSKLWEELTYVVFDAPRLEKPFEARLAFVDEFMKTHQPRHAKMHTHLVCEGVDHLRAELTRLEALGGEGLMLRQPGSRYENGRSTTLQKLKSFHDAEARVLAHQEGAGRHKGRLGALFVELEDGTKFAVGTGFSDAERENPPPVGSLITFRYQELSDGGVPRFPAYVGVREIASTAKGMKKEESVTSPAAGSAVRRFEFTEGSSSKFWEISVAGVEITVRYGRTGTQGQSNVKTFPTQEAAAKQVAKQCAEKVGKGYQEIGPV